MIKPFHLSIVVPDIEAVRDFYVKVLGCEIGRDKGTWIDIIFYGHQVTIHQEHDGMRSKAIDHFGPVLAKEEWLRISNKCISSGTDFVLPPTIKGEGSELEFGKFIVKDPAGNTLEFKYYTNCAATIKVKNV